MTVSMTRWLTAEPGALGEHGCAPAYADMLITPWGWAVSMLVGTRVMVILRTRPSRR